jgi:hypothetical protein
MIVLPAKSKENPRTKGWFVGWWEIGWTLLLSRGEPRNGALGAKVLAARRMEVRRRPDHAPLTWPMPTEQSPTGSPAREPTD